MQVENRQEFLNETDSRVETLGISGLYIFALFAWLGSAGAYLGLSLMLVAFVFDWRNAWPVIKQERLFVIFLLFVIYIYTRVMFASDEVPQGSTARWEAANEWATLWLFPLVAWWAQGNVKRLINLLGLAWISLVLGILRKADWARWESLLEGGRSGFGMTALGTALFSGVAVMGLILLAPRLWGDPQKRTFFALRIMLWLTVLFACLFVLIVTQSRAVWILVGIVLPFTLLLRVRGSVVTEYVHDHKITASVSLLVVVLMGGVLANYAGPVKKRLLSEQNTIEKILARDWGNIPLTSIGARVHLNRFGWQRWLEHPWFGWGPGINSTHDLTQPEELSANLLPSMDRLGTNKQEGVWRLGKAASLEPRSPANNEKIYRLTPTKKINRVNVISIVNIGKEDVLNFKGQVWVSDDFDGEIIAWVSTLGNKSGRTISKFGRNYTLYNRIPIEVRNQWYDIEGFYFRNNFAQKGPHRFIYGVKATQGYVRYKDFQLQRVLGNPRVVRLKPYVDLHNSYLEVLVRFGLVGALLFGIAIFFVLRALWFSYKKGITPRDLFLFFSGAFAVTAAWALIDFRMIHMDFRLYTILFGGLMYTFYLTDLRERLTHKRHE